MRSTLRHARRTRCVALFKTVHAERKEQKELLAKATRTWQGYRRLRKARTGSTNGKKRQLQNGIRNADEYRGAM
jgi:hypothetical protein